MNARFNFDILKAVSMIIIEAKDFGPRSKRLRLGFTLAEMMVGMILGALVLLGVLTAYIFFCRTGMGIVQYSDMENQAAATVQRFGQDARQAQAITWNSDTKVTFTYNDNSTIYYQYISNSGTFVRSQNNSPAKTLASGIQSFAFIAYSYANAAPNEAPAQLVISTDLSRNEANTRTSMVRIEIVLRRNHSSVVNATAQAVSASYVLRNKVGT